MGQNAMRGDRFHATLGMHSVPSERIVGGDMKPVQLAGNAQARFVGVDERGVAQILRDQIRSAVPCNAVRASPTHATSVPGEMARPYTSRISSAARAYGSIRPRVR